MKLRLGDPNNHNRYRLKSRTGEYLHSMDLSRMTKEKHWAWMGNGKQVLNVRELFPHAKELRTVRVGKPKEQVAYQ